MTDKWKLDPGGFLPFLNLLRDNSDVHCSNKATEGAFFTSMMRIRIEDLMKRKEDITYFRILRIENAV